MLRWQTMRCRAIGGSQQDDKSVLSIHVVGCGPKLRFLHNFRACRGAARHASLQSGKRTVTLAATSGCLWLRQFDVDRSVVGIPALES